MKTLTKSSSISYIKRMRFKVEKLPVVQTEIQALEQSQQEMLRQDYELVETMGIEFVFVRDEEGYVYKKIASQVTGNETIISEKQYMKESGLLAYEKQFSHGGARDNAGRKQKFGSPLQFQIRVTKEERDFISYAREHQLDYAKLMEPNT